MGGIFAPGEWKRPFGQRRVPIGVATTRREAGDWQRPEKKKPAKSRLDFDKQAMRRLWSEAELVLVDVSSVDPV